MHNVSHSSSIILKISTLHSSRPETPPNTPERARISHRRNEREQRILDSPQHVRQSNLTTSNLPAIPQPFGLPQARAGPSNAVADDPFIVPGQPVQLNGQQYHNLPPHLAQMVQNLEPLAAPLRNRHANANAVASSSTAPRLGDLATLHERYQNLPPLQPGRQRNIAPAVQPIPLPVPHPVPQPVPPPAPQPALQPAPHPAPHPAPQPVLQPLQAAPQQVAIPHVAPVPAAAQPLPPLQAHPRPLPKARRPHQDRADLRHDLGRMNVQCPNCHALHWKAERVSKSSLINPRFGMCCLHGKCKLPDVQEPPEPLKTLLSAQTTQAKNFRKHIRQYNAALAFTSTGGNFSNAGQNAENAGGGGPYSFRLMGEMYHQMSTLLPPADNETQPSYAQLYIYDPILATAQRMNRNPGLDENVMRNLHDMIKANHFYANIYQQANEIFAGQAQTPNMQLKLHFDAGTDARRYNLPTAQEVALILPGDGSEVDNRRDIILRYRAQLGGGLGLQRIHQFHASYHPLHYVLLFPCGEHGWHTNIPWHQNADAQEQGGDGDAEPDQDPEDVQGRVSQCLYYSYRLHTRPNDAPTLFQAGALFQQYIVDCWAATDQSRLNYLRNNQDKLRAASYKGLTDVIAAGDVQLNQVGQRFILPSSYIGGSHNMFQLFQDSMGICRYFRKPSLFVTGTCNPKWPEITNELLPGQTAADRPDLVARVFQQKKAAILNDILKEGIFGKAVAHVYTIEFQKRGLPHFHLLIFLHEDDQIKETDDVDSFIRAEFPDKETEPLLFDVVWRTMVHGPCGEHNPNAPCMKDGKCSKRYPKPYREETTLNEDGYPNYRRRNDGRKFQLGNHWVDNRDVIPFCAYLSLKYDCHINVEVCATVKSVKYIHKYIYKGHDRITMEFGKPIDEIKQYLDARWISPPEGIWRLYRFRMHDEKPSVTRLQIHLPGEQHIIFDPNDAPEDIVPDSEPETTLTAYFKANIDYPEQANPLLYQEFPQQFVWHTSPKPKHWAPRKRAFAIGRMYFVSPTAGEVFYLRTLLTAVRGATSFQHLRTVNGVVHHTFQQACLALGLLENDNEWMQCLEEAGGMQSGSQLRSLFATMLLFCHPSQPAQLWEQFREKICDDIRPKLIARGVVEPSQEQIYDYGLWLLEKNLQASGKSLAHFPPMPMSNMNWEGQHENRLILEQLAYNKEEEKRLSDEQVPKLNLEQRAAYDEIMISVHQKLGKMFFLNGPGGTGKTFCYGVLCHTLRAEDIIVICVASSGIAALLLPGGRTAHSRCKIPIVIHAQSFCNMKPGSDEAQLFKHDKTALIIYDEVPMQNRYGPEALDRTLRDLRQDDRWFGGITVVFGGDFQQTLPVIPKGSRQEMVGASLLKSPLWAHIKVLHLKQNMRAQGDPDFAQWLLDVGHGRLTAANGTFKFPAEMRVGPDVKDLIKEIYPGLDSLPHPPDQYFLDRSILSARNDDVDSLNHDMLKIFPGEEIMFHSADSVQYEEGADGVDQPYPPEWLETITASGLPLARLALKVGCPLMLLRNLDPSEGLCNGTRLILLRVSNRVLEGRILGGSHAGKRVFIPRITLIPSDSTLPFILKRRQFPVRIALAMSINKSQGQSIAYVGLDLRTSVFTHGQLYVALSRAIASNRIKILLSSNVEQPITKNIVYPEVLLD